MKPNDKPAEDPQARVRQLVARYTDQGPAVLAGMNLAERLLLLSATQLHLGREQKEPLGEVHAGQDGRALIRVPRHQLPDAGLRILGGFVVWLHGCLSFSRALISVLRVVIAVRTPPEQREPRGRIPKRIRDVLLAEALGRRSRSRLGRPPKLHRALTCVPPAFPFAQDGGDLRPYFCVRSESPGMNFASDSG